MAFSYRKLNLVFSRQTHLKSRDLDPPHGFTLVELLVVMGAIALMMALMVPALAPLRGRALDASTSQLLLDLESARLMAITERTRARLLLPSAQQSELPTDIALRGYLITSLDRTKNTWRMRGKWTRLAEGIAFNSKVGVMDPSQSPKPPTTLDTFTFTGPYIEFQANGGSSLDPNGTPEQIALGSGMVQTTGSSTIFTAQNSDLSSRISIDPLTGSATVQ